MGKYTTYIPYALHYNPRIVYLLFTFWSPKTFFQGAFFLKFWPLCMVSIQEGFLMLKFIYLRRPQNFEKSPPNFWLALHRTKVRWRFSKILWPSQNIWTLWYQSLFTYPQPSHSPGIIVDASPWRKSMNISKSVICVCSWSTSWLFILRGLTIWPTAESTWAFNSSSESLSILSTFRFSLAFSCSGI